MAVGGMIYCFWEDDKLTVVFPQTLMIMDELGTYYIYSDAAFETHYVVTEEMEYPHWRMVDSVG